MIEWDENKRQDVLRRRGIDLLDAALIFENDVITQIDDRRDYGEQRLRALGERAGEVLHVAFTRRGAAVRIISVRKASRRERAEWLSRG